MAEVQEDKIQDDEKEAEIWKLLLPSSRVEDEISSELQQWRKDLAHTASRGTLRGSLGLFSMNGTTVQLHLLLMDCLLNHRWQEALEVLLSIAKQPTLPAESITKVALEVFAHYPGNEVLLEQLLNQLRDVSSVEKKELSLEYALNLMKDGKLIDADKQFKMSQKPLGRFRRPETEYTTHIAQLFQAYQGMLAYAEWLQVRQALQNIQKDAEVKPMDVMAESSLMERQMRSLSTKALDKLRGLEEEPGCWDIFVNKVVELHESIDELDSARDVLERYANKHPDNPNAHLLLYRFLFRHCLDETLQMESLQKFCDAVPSDELALTLHDLHIKKGSRPGQCIYLIFDLLDYPCWSGLTRAWQLLRDQLIAVATSGSEDDVKDVQTCWKEREEWWPLYHFTPIVTKDAVTTECLHGKAVIAVLLLGSGNAYSSSVIAHCQTDELREQIHEAALYHDVLSS